LSKLMYPHIPPLLPPSKGVTDDAVGETHWVVKNGIRFSGMPSFGTKLSETELWQSVSFCITRISYRSPCRTRCAETSSPDSA
jgi:hypothetical protein